MNNHEYSNVETNNGEKMTPANSHVSGESENEKDEIDDCERATINFEKLIFQKIKDAF